jgi:hypothetical protein
VDLDKKIDIMRKLSVQRIQYAVTFKNFQGGIYVNETKNEWGKVLNINMQKLNFIEEVYEP